MMLPRVLTASCAVLMLVRCSSDEPDPANAAVGSSPTCVEAPDTADVLFVVDNSSNAGELQPRLAQAAGEVLRALVTGDVDGDGSADFAPFRSVKGGVVTTDLGLRGASFVIPTCGPIGGGGRLLDASSAPGCESGLASVVTLDGPDDVEMAQRNVDCLLRAGTEGCGYEMPLEAMLEAIRLAEEDDPANAGLLREGSVLIVVIAAGEDDCSAEDLELFNASSTLYASNLSVRCELFPQALFGIERYVDGLLAGRPASRVVYGLIGGVPEAFDGRSPAMALADPRVGQPVVPMDNAPPATVCETQATQAIVTAAPRLVTLARDLDAQGAFVDVASVCQDDFTAAAQRLAGLARAARQAPCPAAAPGP